MAPSPSQRSYSAPCPGCGAPVHFASAQSSFAVCAFCRSTVVRQGDVLQRVGQMAEVFEDYSPLQVGTSGMVAREGVLVPFTLVGRLQYKSDAGGWTEWVAALSDGELAWLSEDNGQFVFAFAWQPPGWQVTEFKARDWQLGRAKQVGGDEFTVTSVQTAQLVAAQGELPQIPATGKPFRLVELREPQGKVLSVDFSSRTPQRSLGHPVALDDLKLQGLRVVAPKKEAGRHFNCPQCGAAVTVQLESTKAMSCPSCGSLVDLTRGLGQELHASEQRRKVRPQIPLGSTGHFDGVDWQVVGFQRRSGRELGEEDESETFEWDEYLLYSAKAGFAFVVDSADGWSMARVVSGVPKLSKSGGTATYLRQQYSRESSYLADTLYAEGEFYWPVAQGQRTSNVDYVNVGKRSSLAQETGQGETTWTHGQQVAVDRLAQAFGVGKLKDRSQAGPLSGSRFSWGSIFFGVFLLLFLLPFLRGCIPGQSCDPRTDPNCNYSRSSSGSYGGYTSGGSHK